MSRSLHRSLSALAAVGIAVATPVAFAGTAQAAAKSEHCDSVKVEYKVDGAKDWSTAGRLKQPSTKITVRIQDNDKKKVGSGCEYKVSLASYNTEGPTWATSGTQTFLGWDHTVLTKAHPQATLDVSKSAPTCFGQIDLYGNDEKHDGVEGDLPKYPDGVFPRDLITAWNGGKACTPTPSASPTATPTEGTSPTASATPTESASPTASTSASASPSASATTVPSASPSAPVPTSTDGPVGTPTVAPVSEVADASLAATGGNSTQTTAITVGGVALLALGGGAVFLTRRRAAQRG